MQNAIEPPTKKTKNDLPTCWNKHDNCTIQPAAIWSDSKCQQNGQYSLGASIWCSPIVK